MDSLWGVLGFEVAIVLCILGVFIPIVLKLNGTLRETNGLLKNMNKTQQGVQEVLIRVEKDLAVLFERVDRTDDRVKSIQRDLK